MTVATALRVEMQRFQPSSKRAREAFEALEAQAAAVGVELVTTDQYRAQGDWLLMWGPGEPSRFEPMRQQLARGGHVVAFDLAYWSRHRKVRVSIDAAHPSAWVMRAARSMERFAGDPVTVGDLFHVGGPVLIAGIGPKARVQYGGQVEAWEQQMIRRCRALGRTVLYKTKKVNDQPPAGVMPCHEQDIEKALRGAAALITWHSNAAVDAIRLGVPVICRDGAAAAICQSDFIGETLPPPLAPWVRDQFLWNLAWFQWDLKTEARACWKWLFEVLA